MKRLHNNHQKIIARDPAPSVEMGQRVTSDTWDPRTVIIQSKYDPISGMRGAGAQQHVYTPSSVPTTRQLVIECPC